MYEPQPLFLLAPVVRARVEGQGVARAGGVAEDGATVHVEVNAGTVPHRATRPAAASTLRFMIVIASGALGLGLKDSSLSNHQISNTGWVTHRVSDLGWVE